MAGKTPLVLAAFLFGIGASGLLLLATAEQRSWGPFQPPVQTTTPRLVIDYHVPPEITPPPLAELFTSGTQEAFVAAVEAQTTEPVAQPDIEVSEPEPEPTPTPPSPIRIFGVSSDDPGVSAAASTPTPVTLRIGGISADSADPEPEVTETPTAEETPAATPEP